MFINIITLLILFESIYLNFYLTNFALLSSQKIADILNTSSIIVHLKIPILFEWIHVFLK